MDSSSSSSPSVTIPSASSASASSLNIQNYLYSYRRSAAGREILSSSSLRSLEILEMSVHYLFHHVFLSNGIYPTSNDTNEKKGLEEEYRTSNRTNYPDTVISSPSPTNRSNTISSPLGPSFRSPVRTTTATTMLTSESTTTDNVMEQPLLTYYYMMDRLRSIMADGRVQKFKGERWLRCILSAVRYHIFIDYLLGSRNRYEKLSTNQSIESQKYETKFNDQRIMDYIATILLLWENYPEKGICSQYYTEALAFSFLLHLTVPGNSSTTTNDTPSSVLSTVLIRLRNHGIHLGPVLSITIQLLSAWYSERYHYFLKLIDDLYSSTKTKTVAVTSAQRTEQEGLGILRYLVHRHVVTARSLLLLSRVKATPSTLKLKLTITDILPWLRIHNEYRILDNSSNSSNNQSMVPAWYAAAMLCLVLEIPLEYTDTVTNTLIVMKKPYDLHELDRSKATNDDKIPNLIIQFHNPSERISKTNDIGTIFTMLTHDHGGDKSRTNDTNSSYLPSLLLQPYREDQWIGLEDPQEWSNLLCLI